jgi:hypothetical protein
MHYERLHDKYKLYVKLLNSIVHSIIGCKIQKFISTISLIKTW